MIILVEYRGREMPLADAVALAGSVIGTRMAKRRIMEMNWPVDRAVETHKRGTFKPDRRERDRLKKIKQRAKKRAEWGRTATGSKTSAAYRQIVFGVVPEMSKSELRAVLAQAVQNTAAMGELR